MVQEVNFTFEPFHPTNKNIASTKKGLTSDIEFVLQSFFISRDRVHNYFSHYFARLLLQGELSQRYYELQSYFPL